MNREDGRLHTVPPMRLPNGTPAQLRCMDAVALGLKYASRRDLERLVRAVSGEVDTMDGPQQELVNAARECVGRTNCWQPRPACSHNLYDDPGCDISFADIAPVILALCHER